MGTVLFMDDTLKNQEWARTAVARLVRRCTERAARDMEMQAAELLLAAAHLRNPWR